MKEPLTRLLRVSLPYEKISSYKRMFSPSDYANCHYYLFCIFLVIYWREKFVREFIKHELDPSLFWLHMELKVQHHTEDRAMGSILSPIIFNIILI